MRKANNSKLLQQKNSKAQFSLPDEAIAEFIQLVETEFLPFGFQYDDTYAKEHSTRYLVGFESSTKVSISKE